MVQVSQNRAFKNIDFRNIRTLEGRQDVAFEEFCCQIARRSKGVPPCSTFFRLRGAGGDGGVECLWRLPNGEEWGWQAKYIFTLKKDQLDESVRTALKIHPKLTRYTFCLPFNLTGATARRGKGEIEKYRHFENSWQSMARRKHMRVKFIRLGKTELLDDLLEFDPNQGRLRFWSDEMVFGYEWFDRQVREMAKVAEPRYTPELTVEVPVYEAFETFGRTPHWTVVLSDALRKINQAVEEWGGRFQGDVGPDDMPFPKSAAEPAAALDKNLAEIKSELVKALENPVDAPSLPRLSGAIEESIQLGSECLSYAREEFEAKYGTGSADSVGLRQWMAEYQVSFPARHIDTTAEILKILQGLNEQLSPRCVCLARSSAMLLLGATGVGKTHAICDAALDRLKHGLLSIVLFGEQFSAGEPWSQITQLVGLGAAMSRELFLSALDAAGEATGYPCIIFIDALNETQPRGVWFNHLARLIDHVSHYKWLKLCVSCRSTFRDEVIAANVQIPEFQHLGFEGVEFDACFEFFRFYKLDAPSIPLMQPEFSNPLFLRLLCESLRDAGATSIPERNMGIGEVIQYFLDSKNRKLARVLNYHPNEHFVEKALDLLISAMRESQRKTVPWEQAKELVDSLWPATQRSTSLFDHLLRENLISEDRVVKLAGPGTYPIVRLGFERMTEHLLARKYLEGISPDSLDSIFLPEGALHFAVADEGAIHKNQGLLEEIGIQIPEKYGRELLEVIKPPSAASSLVDVFLLSLLWRTNASYGPATERLIRRALGASVTCSRALEVLFALSTRPGNPLNASWLHDLLSSIPMPDRDALLCPYLHVVWGQSSSVDRLIKWALKANLNFLSHETAELWATQLCWFCAASDRRVRDYATMAIVRVMEQHLEKWPEVIERFAAVDDEYVVERCLAAAYGSLIRAGTSNEIRAVAGTVYEVFFARSRLPQNAMIRDYARLILELAAARNALPAAVSAGQFRPPYDSEWPPTWPEESTIEQYKDSHKDLPKLYRSCFDDDFSHYTVNHAFREYEGVTPLDARRWIFGQVLEMGYTKERFSSFDRYLLTEYGPGRSKPVPIERIGKKYQWIALFRLLARVADHLPKARSRFDPPSPSVAPLQGQALRDIDPTILMQATQAAKTTAWWSPAEYRFDAVASLSDQQWLATRDFPPSEEMLSITNPKDGGNWLVLESYPEWSSKGTGEESQKEPFRQVWLQLRSYLIPRKEPDECWRWLCGQHFMGGWMPEGSDMYGGFLGEYPWALPFQEYRNYWRAPQGTSQVPFKFTPTAHSLGCADKFDSYHNRSLNVLVPADVFFEDESNSWDGSGGYRTGEGKLSFYYPPTKEQGPPALLVEREYLSNFLGERGLALVWTVLGEKLCIHPFDASDSPGLLEYSRAHIFLEGKIKSSKGIVKRVRPRSG